MGELLQSKPDGFASSLGREPLAKRSYRTAKGPISEGAGTEGDWTKYGAKKPKAAKKK